MNKKLIVANFKMHFNVQEASLYLNNLNKLTSIHRSVEVALAPPFISLQPLRLEIDPRKFKLCAQNGYYQDEGAFTGEVSFALLKNLVHFVIIGHSERRIYFHEDLELIRDKMAACVRNGLTPILCIGENKSERISKETKKVLHDQISTALYNLTLDEVANVVIAYEPIWAISTFGGEIPKPREIQSAIDFIRFEVSELFGSKVSNQVKILYGGSVNSDLVSAYLSLEGCNGALVGGASLNYQEFAKIIQKAYLIDRQG